MLTPTVYLRVIAIRSHLEDTVTKSRDFLCRALAGLMLIASVLGVHPTDALAQATATTGQIEGTLSDGSGGALPGAIITATNKATGFVRETLTDERGFYRLGLLPLGTYDVAAELSGFATAHLKDVVLTVGQTRQLPIALTLATVEENVTVASVAEVRTLPAATIDETAIDSLPINGRRFQDFALLTPGAMVEGQRSGTSINGQRGINTAFNVDGTSWDNPFFGGIKGGERSNEAYTISQEVIEQFQINNAGYSAEFGRSGGGVMNAVTKSGTNTMSGSAFWYFRNEGMVADDSFGRPPTDFKQHQFGATMGGPIVVNRTHFFAAYDQQVKSNPLIVEFTAPNQTGAGIPGFEGKSGSVTQTNDIWTLFGRVDHRINNANTLWLRYNWSKNRGENGLGSSPTNFAPESSSLERDETNTFVTQWSSIITPRLLNEVRFQFGRENRPRTPNTDAVTITVTGLGTIGRSTSLPSLETDDRYQFVDNFTYVRGAHSFRAGTDINLLNVRQPFFLSRSGGEYRFNSINDYLTTLNTGQQVYRDYRQGFGRTDVAFWQKEMAFYIQDTWSISGNLTINYGLRYDAQFNPQPDQPNPALEGSDQIPSDTNNWGPRAGFSWDPFKDARTVVRGNVGLYYSRTPALLMVSPFTTNGLAAYQITFTPTTVGVPIFPNVLTSAPTGATAPRSDVIFFNDEFDNPRTLQISGGVEREVFARLTLGIDVIYADTKNLQRLFDINLAPASGTAADGRLLYQTPRPNTAFARMLQTESTAKARYVGTTLSARRRWAGGDEWYNQGFQLQAFYTYGQAKDDDSNERNFSSTFYQDWQNLGVEYTWAETDIRHNFVVNATLQLAHDFQIGLIQTDRTGRPYSLKATSDLNNDGTFDNDRQFVNGVDTGRNAFRHPNFHRTDLRVTKMFRLPRAANVAEVSVDLFNLWNNANEFVGSTNRNFVGNVNAGVPNEQIGGSRQMQISLRYRF